MISTWFRWISPRGVRDFFRCRPLSCESVLVVNINHVLPSGSWIAGLCDWVLFYLCILEWSWCVCLDCQYLRLAMVTRRTSPLASAFLSVILGRRRWWSDRFSGSGHSWQSWRSMAANSLKATLLNLQSTKVPWEPVLITENEGEIFFPRFARNDRRYLYFAAFGSVMALIYQPPHPWEASDGPVTL